MKNLKSKFKAVIQKIDPQIQMKCAQAALLLEEAVKLSEDNGVPFIPKTKIMFCSPSYIPKTLTDKFPNLDVDFWQTLTETYQEDETIFGWQEEQIC